MVNFAHHPDTKPVENHRIVSGLVAFFEGVFYTIFTRLPPAKGLA